MNGGGPSIETVAVVGAGTMGRGIAQVAATAGCSVLLWDQAPQALERAQEGIAQSLDRLAEKEGHPQGWKEAILQRLQFAESLETLCGAQLIIEAVVEELEAKRTLFRRLAPLLGKSTLVASNTSTLSITALAAASGHPERFAGLHFFNPAPLMPLVELIPGLTTASETVDRLRAFVQHLGKEAVLCPDRPGFVVNRLLLPLINTAVQLLDSGAAKSEDIDRAMTLGAGHPMGPLQLADLVGLDVVLLALESMQEELGEAQYRPATLLRRMVEAGQLGRKCGKGFYEY